MEVEKLEVTETTIEYKGEKFTRSTYNEISVLIDSEGYYNASKICKDNGTDFRQVSRYDYWTSYIKDLRGVCDFTDTTLIKERLNLSNEIKGIYIHKKLVNFLCFHLNNHYAIKVGKIMDIIDERIKRDKTTLETEIERLKRLAVPAYTNNKKLRVMRIDENTYKISGDSNIKDNRMPYPVIRTYIFASSMNIRKQLRDNNIISKGLIINDYENFDRYIHDHYEILYES